MIELHSRPDDPAGKVLPLDGVARIATLEVRCRACPPCLVARGLLWRDRAMAEYRAAPRTWFGTLTLAPEAHAHIANIARLVASSNGDDFDAYDAAKQFALRHKYASAEITKYLKRLRKGGARFRYLVVCEAHKSGLPHYHMLVNELDDGSVRHKQLVSQWRIGFSKFNLAHDNASAAYAVKYLFKSKDARVRASLDYGSHPSPKEVVVPCPPRSPT